MALCRMRNFECGAKPLLGISSLCLWQLFFGVIWTKTFQMLLLDTKILKSGRLKGSDKAVGLGASLGHAAGQNLGP